MPVATPKPQAAQFITGDHFDVAEYATKSTVAAAFQSDTNPAIFTRIGYTVRLLQGIASGCPGSDETGK